MNEQDVLAILYTELAFCALTEEGRGCAYVPFEPNQVPDPNEIKFLHIDGLWFSAPPSALMTLNSYDPNSEFCAWVQDLENSAHGELNLQVCEYAGMG